VAEVKTVKLRRMLSSDQGTFGQLSFGLSSCYTLELPWRDNKVARSCIPVGTYSCKLVQSPKFGRVYHVQNVPGRSAVLIHSANLAGDVDLGYTTQLHGCIAPCLRRGLLRNKAGQMQQAGLVSAPALRNFMEWAAGEPFSLEITSC